MKRIWLILVVLLFIIPISTSANENNGDGQYAKSALTSALFPYVEKAVADYKKTRHITLRFV